MALSKVTNLGTLTESIVFDSTAKGIHLGVTSATASNLMEDYEEGTFSTTCDFSGGSPSAGATAGNGLYTKIGRLVTVHMRYSNINVTGASGNIEFTGLPFTTLSDSDAGASGAVSGYSGSIRANSVNYSGSTFLQSFAIDDATVARVDEIIDNANSDIITASNCTHGTTDFFITIVYPTTS